MDNSINEAIDAWSDIVGRENVVTEAAVCNARATATFPLNHHVPAIIYLSNLSQVQDCVRVANRYRVTIHPVSTGKNWGYGSSAPYATNCTIFDLSKMSRIVDYNEQLGYVTVEPGVTQQQLYEFLQAHGGKYWMDATGSSTACSVIGNTVERGFGHTAYSDHFGNSCDFQVVLADGEILETGLRRYGKAKSAHIYKWGLGPYIEGLFTQSSFGIVTRATIWLMPAPEYCQSFYLGLEKDNDLEGFIEAIQPLRLRRIVDCALHITNPYRMLSAVQQYPWEEMGGDTPLSKEVLEKMCRAQGIGAWGGSGVIAGSRAHVRATRRSIVRALRGRVRRLTFIDDRKLRVAKALQYPYKILTGVDLPKMLKLVSAMHGMVHGIPTDDVLAPVYWRKKTPVPEVLDIDGDGCGLIWIAPLAPATAADARIISNLVGEILPAHGFEPGMTITLLNERCLECVINISYDRDEPGEDEKALECYRVLVAALTSLGYFPYRMGINGFELLPDPAISTDRFLNGLKKWWTRTRS